MTKRDVIVTVSDKQRIDDETEKYETTVVGKAYGTESDYTIEYTEYDGELAGCETKINVRDGSSVSVIKMGSYNSEMIFESEKRHNCHYSTPYGTFVMGIYTRMVNLAVGDDKARLKLEYTIDYNTGLASENFMNITAKFNN